MYFEKIKILSKSDMRNFFSRKLDSYLNQFFFCRSLSMESRMLTTAMLTQLNELRRRQV